jgi:hypothetical protein
VGSGFLPNLDPKIFDWILFWIQIQPWSRMLKGRVVDPDYAEFVDPALWIWFRNPDPGASKLGK